MNKWLPLLALLTLLPVLLLGAAIVTWLVWTDRV